jgi:cephalosporin hydroxylase
MNLYSRFRNNSKNVIHKWEHYFPIYERHLKDWQYKTCTFLEIGVFKGGALQMWKEYLGPQATIIGIDIDPSCQMHESPGVNVRIGDQSDLTFLKKVIDEFGPLDIVIDDGSHQMDHLKKRLIFYTPT